MNRKRARQAADDAKTFNSIRAREEIRVSPATLEQCRIMHRGGVLLKLSPPTICTAISYFHRCRFDPAEDDSDAESSSSSSSFSFSSSNDAASSSSSTLLVNQKFKDPMLATACLFLAAKVAESPRRLREVLTTVDRIVRPDKPFPDLDDRYFKQKERLVSCEQLVLRTLRFDVNYDDRHKLLLHFLKWLDLQARDPQVAQVAFGLMTDATYSPWLCRRCPKRALAASCIVVAADLLERDTSKLFPAGLLPWYGAFGARSLDVIQGCRHLTQLVRQVWSAEAEAQARRGSGGGASSPAV